MIATGETLERTATRLCVEVENFIPGAICSVLTVDSAGLLHPLAGPSLPDAYSAALDGLSIGFRTVRSSKEGRSGKAARPGVRRILEADLWEISVVTFPMLPSARVSDVKHARFFRDRETELVRTMRRAARSLFDTAFKR